MQGLLHCSHRHITLNQGVIVYATLHSVRQDTGIGPPGMTGQHVTVSTHAVPIASL